MQTDQQSVFPHLSFEAGLQAAFKPSL